MKILIVEDNDDNMELLVQLLEDDYEIIEARDGEESLAVADKERPDLILMDLMLPKMSGYEVTKILKEPMNELKSIPVIALTAHAMHGDEEKALAAGCDGYLSKPIEIEALFDVVESFLD